MWVLFPYPADWVAGVTRSCEKWIRLLVWSPGCERADNLYSMQCNQWRYFKRGGKISADQALRHTSTSAAAKGIGYPLLNLSSPDLYLESVRIEIESVSFENVSRITWRILSLRIGLLGDLPYFWFRQQFGFESVLGVNICDFASSQVNLKLFLRDIWPGFIRLGQNPIRMCYRSLNSDNSFSQPKLFFLFIDFPHSNVLNVENTFFCFINLSAW